MKKPKKQWTASRAGAVLDEADRSPNDPVYAKATGINIGRLAWWRSRLRRPRRKLCKRIAFVEVQGSPVSESTTVEVLLVNGRRFRVIDRLDPSVVAHLADALDTPC